MRDGRVRLYTMNGADWSKRYPLIIKDATSIASYRSGKSKAWIKVKKSNAPAATRAVDGTF
jgi:ATP-dependent DNA ligase